MTDKEIATKIGAWILGERGIEWQEIISCKEVTIYGGFCSTCSYEEERMRVRYHDMDNVEQKYDSYYSFSDGLLMLLKGEM